MFFFLISNNSYVNTSFLTVFTKFYRNLKEDFIGPTVLNIII